MGRGSGGPLSAVNAVSVGIFVFIVIHGYIVLMLRFFSAVTLSAFVCAFGALLLSCCVPLMFRQIKSLLCTFGFLRPSC